jgi:group I intron endonuclease
MMGIKTGTVIGPPYAKWPSCWKAWKDSGMIDRSGVYKIINVVNGRVYVGSAARTFRGRWFGHINSLRAGVHSNSYLQRAWNKYGEEAFVFWIVETCPSEKCVEREQVWIDATQSFKRNKGYNISPSAGSLLGIKYEGKALENIKKANKGKNKGRKHRPEVVEAIRLRMKGKLKGYKHTDEMKAKTAAAAKKQWENPEHRKLMAAAMKKHWDKPGVREAASAAGKEQWERPGYRESMSAKLSVAMTGKKYPPKKKEYLVKLSERMKGVVHSQETRDKISASLTGRKFDPEKKARWKEIRNRPEVKKKMSIGIRAWWDSIKPGEVYEEHTKNGIVLKTKRK